MLVKNNAIELLRQELARKRVKGYVSTGSMNDAYMPLERSLCLTQRALQVIAEYRFPVHLLTKSDLILRDFDLIETIKARAGDAGHAAGTAGAVVSFTITTVDDDLARQLEPGAPPPSRRLAALERFAKRGIRTGLMMMPILPFIEDTVQNITAVVTRAHACGASYVVPGFGVTLRDRQRLYYYDQLDRLFPGLSETYERTYGERYSAAARDTARLEMAFEDLRLRLGIQRCVPAYAASTPEQLALF